MSVVLQKGGRATLGKNGAKFAAGLSWDAPDSVNGHKFDLDVTAFVCGKDAAGDPKIFQGNDKYMIYYHNTSSPCGAVNHSGDVQDGSKAGDDETIVIDTSLLPQGVEEIGIVVTLYDAIPRGQNFGQAKKPKIRIYDPDTGSEIAMFELDEDFSNDQSVQFGSVYQRNGEWRFNAVGAGFSDRTLADFCSYYGVPVG